MTDLWRRGWKRNRDNFVCGPWNNSLDFRGCFRVVWPRLCYRPIFEAVAQTTMLSIETPMSSLLAGSSDPHYPMSY